MILEHEIPDGSKLHFGASAKLKREMENIACDIFYTNGFDEIISPVFVYGEHQESFLTRDIIRLNNDKNHQISMRNDSTIDVIRIITKRLGRTTNHKKWFYIQPVFSYPTNEFNQIGAECLDENSIHNVLSIAIDIFKALKVKPILQVANANIAKLCVQNSDLQMKYFTTLDIDRLQQVDFVSNLLKINTRHDLAENIKNMPSFLKEELQYLLELASIDYDNILCSPLLPSPVDYYKDLFFRAFLDNYIFLLGGRYEVEKIISCGFGIYTDNVVRHLFRIKNKG